MARWGPRAPSLAESLQRQAVAAIATGSAPPEVRVLVSAGLGSVVEGPTCGLSTEGLRVALAWLRPRLSVDLFDAADAAATARRCRHAVAGQATGCAAVVGGPWSAVQLADSYRAAAVDPRVRPDVVRAERFVTALGRRDQTLARVADLVVVRQEGQVRAGVLLTDRSPGERLRSSSACTSRPSAERWQASRWGCRPAAGAARVVLRAGGRVLRSLRCVVDGEVEPMSDAALAAVLVRQGYVVARRTVAKYRAALGIPDRRQRRPGALLRCG